MLESTQNHLWRLLWEYDPNGLIAVDTDLIIKIVNPAFCQLFNVDKTAVIGQNATTLLGNIDRFKWAWAQNKVIRDQEAEYPHHHLFVKEFIFPIKDENIIACIMVDITAEMQQKQEMVKIQSETVKKVKEVVDNQMKVAQEIAGLLGETTAETKVSLLKITELFHHESSE
jgi:PAS domain S-box-containing protein